MPTGLKAVTFAGPAGSLEGLWKEAPGPRLGKLPELERAIGRFLVELSATVQL
jgi:hypothetical protein